jgi:hypothetical protein
LYWTHLHIPFAHKTSKKKEKNTKPELKEGIEQVNAAVTL